MKSVIDYLERWAAVQPDKLLFEFRDVRARTLDRQTYSSFCDRTLLIAAHLIELGGLTKGDRVLLAYPPGLEGIAALLACSRVGLIGVPVPLPQSESGAAFRRLCSIGHDCEAGALLSNGNHLPRLRHFTQSKEAPSARWRLFNSDDFIDAPTTPALCSNNEVFFLQYTSGSTGHPRGVVVTHDNVLANARATIDHSAVGVSWLPQHHDMGLIGYYLFPIVTGGTNVGFAPSDFLRRPALWLRIMSEVRATYSSSPNFGFEYCLRDGKINEEELEEVDLSSVRVLMNASEPVRPQTFVRFHERFARYGLRKSACTVAYGLAENTLTVTHGGLGSVRVDRQTLRTHGVAVVECEDAQDIAEYACCGVPAAGVALRICSPESGQPLDSLVVGEIQVAGESVTRGYWGKELANSVFVNHSHGQGGAFERYIRTGDLGFLYQGALYVCGRIKDLIILGGLNLYPEDIEEAVAENGFAVRAGGSCAFQTEDGRVVVVVEARRESVPDPWAVAEAIRKASSVTLDLVLIVPPKSVAKTTSGKIARSQTRALFVSGALSVLASYRCNARAPSTGVETDGDLPSQLRRIFTSRGTSDEGLPLADSGLDSLALMELQLEIEEILRGAGAGQIADAIDGQLLQRLSLKQLLSALTPLERGLAEGLSACLAALSALRASIDDAVHEQMRYDSQWQLPVHIGSMPASATGRDILLTGATGFFGPFLLDELLRQTDATVLVLVRARTPAQALERIEAALGRARLMNTALRQALPKRVRPVCGDLSLPLWGLARTEWTGLADRVREVFHNAACVNYIMSYKAVRPANVDGIRTALQLAFEGGARTLNLISSTFIFGWTAKGTLSEADCNPEMHALDFGYTQSKWVAEQLALGARKRGLDVRIYRPALISVSSNGAGDPNDVAIRMLDFMIRHRIAVDTLNQLSILPADVIAHNIVGISQLGEGHGPALHVTADRFYSVTELTGVISRDFGCYFEYYDIPGFMNELNRRCSPRDPVYPLLDFFNRSADKIAAMQLKRYSNSAYQQARARLRDPRPDPSLEDTARYIMSYLATGFAELRQLSSGRSPCQQR